MEEGGNIEKIRRRFTAADTDADGKLNRLEFMNLLKSFRVELAIDQLSMLFQQTDTDQDGFISFQEFTDVFTGKQLQKMTEPRSWKRSFVGRRGSALPTNASPQNKEVRTLHVRNASQRRGSELQTLEYQPTISELDSPLNEDMILQLPPTYGRRNSDQGARLQTAPKERTRRASEWAMPKYPSPVSKDLERPSNGVQISLTPAEQLNELRKYFMEWDEYSKGKLSWKQLMGMLEDKGLNLPDEILSRAFTECHKHGSLSFSDFVNLFEKAEDVGQLFQKPGMSEQEVTEYCSYFWSSDGDCDGKLSKEEFCVMIDALGMNLKKFSIERAFAIADTNHDGTISFSEFVATYLNTDNTPRVLSHKQILDVFRRHDQQGDGYLTKTGICEVLKSLGNRIDDERLEQFMSVIDANNDGRISLKEFCDFLEV